MKKRIMFVASGLAALAILLAALPGPSAGQGKKESPRARVRAERAAQSEAERATQDLTEDLVADALELELLDQDSQDVKVFSLLGDDGSWLGVELAEVNAERAKELKLPAERGVVLQEIVPDSPAAKAGLLAKDVVTEFNGQRVEGAAQFRRMIRETPAGRTVQLTIWRDGRSESVSVVLGEGQQRHRIRADKGPQGEMRIEMPRMPKIEIPRFEFNGNLLFSHRPMLGVSVDELSGQLGSYFGAPEGEGVLVREVNSGSPAEKAGIKAGDVIIKVNGERVRTSGDLHARLGEKFHDGADKAEKATITIVLLRDHKEMTVNAELERPQAPKARRTISRRTSI